MFNELNKFNIRRYTYISSPIQLFHYYIINWHIENRWTVVTNAFLHIHRKYDNTGIWL